MTPAGIQRYGTVENFNAAREKRKTTLKKVGKGLAIAGGVAAAAGAAYGLKKLHGGYMNDRLRRAYRKGMPEVKVISEVSSKKPSSFRSTPISSLRTRSEEIKKAKAILDSAPWAQKMGKPVVSISGIDVMKTAERLGLTKSLPQGYSVRDFGNGIKQYQWKNNNLFH